MNFILAIIVTVIQHAVLHSCRTVTEATFAVQFAEAGAPDSHSPPDKKNPGNVPIPTSKYSQEAKYYSSLKRDQEHQAKITVPRYEEKGTRRKLFNTNKKRLIELLPVNHKRRGKMVAYILAPDTRAVKGLINEPFEINDEEASHSDEEISDISKESSENLYNDPDRPEIQYESHENHHKEHSNQNFANVVKTIPKESNSNEETDGHSNSVEARHNLNSNEYEESSHDLATDDDSDEKSELQYLHKDKFQEDSTDDHDVHHTEDIKNNANDYSDEEENLSLPISQANNNENSNSTSYNDIQSYEKSRSVESENESDTSQNDFELEWNTSQEINSQSTKYSTDAINHHISYYSDESTAKDDGDSDKFIDDKIDSGNERDQHDDIEISDMKPNELTELIESFEEDIPKRKHDCKQVHKHRGGGSSRKRVDRHPCGHNTYTLSFLFNR